MPGLLDDDTLGSLDHATLYRMRAAATDPALQNKLAGFEHQAFARELVGDSPWMAPSLALASPLYQAAKMLPAITGNQSRSSPSWGQLGQEYRGIGQGLLGAFQRAFN